jgi:NAD(P)-dependent dehydrogenase (short-subunit alcohol dehydrogenase family)
MVDRLLAAWGRWDVLVSNAAVAITKPFSQISEAEFDLSFAVTEPGRVAFGRYRAALQEIIGPGSAQDQAPSATEERSRPAR